jgi:hypothetical protein
LKPGFTVQSWVALARTFWHRRRPAPKADVPERDKKMD